MRKNVKTMKGIGFKLLLTLYFIHALSIDIVLSNNQSISKIDSIWQIIRDNSENTRALALLYASLSEQLKEEDTDSAKKMAIHGLLLAKNAGYMEGIVRNYLQLGSIALRQDDLSQGKAYFKTITMLLSKDIDTITRIKTFLSLGYVYDLQSENAKALDCYLKGLVLAENITDESWKSQFYNNIAVIYDISGDYRKALFYYQKASNLFRELDQKDYYANSLMNIGVVYKGLGIPDSAKSFYLKSLPLQKQLNNSYGLCNVYNNLGSIYYDDDDFNDALNYFQKADSTINRMEGTFWGSKLSLQLVTQVNFAKTFLKLGAYKKALPIFTRVKSYAGKATMLYVETEAIDGLRETHELLGHSDSALRYAKMYNTYYDSLMHLENRQNVAVKEVEYEYLREQYQARVVKEKEVLKNKKRELLFISLLTVFLLITLLIFFLYLLQRGKIQRMKLVRANLQLEKTNLEMDVSLKNRELTTKAMSLIEKNEFIGDLSKKFKIALEETEKPDMNAIKSMFHELDHRYSDEFWDEFNMRFKEVYTDFYSKLIASFPQLTPNEIKLTAFLKLNFSTKDIALITRKSEHSIKIARYRLRQKLNLSRDENLTMFLNKL